MHFSRILTAVIAACATGVLAVQLTESIARTTIGNLASQVARFRDDVTQAEGGNVGNVSKVSMQIDVGRLVID